MAARKETEESIRLNRFTLDDVDMIDMRFWRETKNGPRPTKKGIVFDQRMLIRLIIALQKVSQRVNSEMAREEAGARS